MSDSDCCSIIDQHLAVNGVAMLHHQTPNLHCCSPEYDYVITDGVAQSQVVEHITQM